MARSRAVAAAARSPRASSSAASAPRRRSTRASRSTSSCHAPLNVNLLRYTKAQGREFYQRVDRTHGTDARRRVGQRGARWRCSTGGARVTTVAVEGRPDSGNRGQSEGGGVSATAGQTALANVIGPGFFETLGIPIVRGPRLRQSGRRGPPARRDRQRDDGEAVLSRARTPIGKRFSTGAARRRTARGSRSSASRATASTRRSARRASAVVYMPLSQQHETGRHALRPRRACRRRRWSRRCAARSRRSSPTCPCRTSRR